MKFDELNQLKAYYKVMELPQKEKQKRIDLALELFDVFYFVLLLIKADIKVEQKRADIHNAQRQTKDDEPASNQTDAIKQSLSAEEYKQSLQIRLDDTLTGIPYEQGYILHLVDDVIDTTMRHLDDEYYVSQERALLIAQNEANTVLNYGDFLTAKENGSKYKTWITENDERVRFAHMEVDGVKIPIEDYFEVGGEQMRYPHDYNASPENVINCRCVCMYS